MKNNVASVTAKLKNIAKEQRIAFDQVFLLYLQERLLYRLSCSAYRDYFILKGGLLLYSLSKSHSRPTKDIDLLGKQVANDLDNIKRIFKTITEHNFVEDAVEYDATSLLVERMKEGADYEGVRVKLTGYIGKMKKQLQLDIGFGDAVVPKAIDMKYPTLLDMDFPNIRVYSLESVIAEKFEAMISLSIANSRMKDFYDIYYLSKISNFDGRVMYEAVFETFQRRGTSIQMDHVIFTEEFTVDLKRIQQWNAFQRKSGQAFIAFEEIMYTIKQFLNPIYYSLLQEHEFFGYWDKDQGQWTNIL